MISTNWPLVSRSREQPMNKACKLERFSSALSFFPTQNWTWIYCLERWFEVEFQSQFNDSLADLQCPSGSHYVSIFSTHYDEVRKRLRNGWKFRQVRWPSRHSLCRTESDYGFVAIWWKFIIKINSLRPSKMSEEKQRMTQVIASWKIEFLVVSRDNEYSLWKACFKKGLEMLQILK